MIDLKQQAWEAVRKMDGWMEETRCGVLIDLMLTHRPLVTVEIGVYGGRSLATLGIASQRLGAGIVWGIDPWSVDAAIEGESEANVEWWSKLDIEAIYIRFMQNIIALQLTQHCRWIRATAEAASPLFADNSIHLLSLDGNHSEFASCREARMWIPKIAPQGVIVMDDTHWESQAKAINLIRASGFRTIHDVKAPDGQAWMAFQKP